MRFAKQIQLGARAVLLHFLIIIAFGSAVFVYAVGPTANPPSLGITKGNFEGKCRGIRANDFVLQKTKGNIHTYSWLDGDISVTLRLLNDNLIDRITINWSKPGPMGADGANELMLSFMAFYRAIDQSITVDYSKNAFFEITKLAADSAMGLGSKTYKNISLMCIKDKRNNSMFFMITNKNTDWMTD